MLLNNSILIISSEFPPQPGGIGNHAYNLALALEKGGKQLTVLTDIRSQDGKQEKTFDLQLPFYVQRVKRRQIIWISYFDRFVKALKLVKKVDTVIASGKFSLWLVFFMKLFYHKKYIAIIHGSEVLLPNKFQRKFTHSSLKKCDTVIAVSNYTKSLVGSLYLKNMVVIPNGFTLSEKQATVLSPQTPKRLNLITVGNVTQRKGQHNVVTALPLLLESYPDLQYHIVGIPTEKDKIETLAKELGVFKHIIFHGKVTEAEKWELLASSSIFIMLSEATATGDVEGFGIAILEANALGIPAIGSKGCGIEDAIVHGESGLLVAAKDDEAVLEAITKINNAYSQFSENAQRRSRNFSWDKIVSQYIEVLEK